MAEVIKHNRHEPYVGNRTHLRDMSIPPLDGVPAPEGEQLEKLRETIAKTPASLPPRRKRVKRR